MGVSNGMNKNFLFAVIILASTIIGAGVFSLPYVFRQIGFVRGVFYLIFFGLVYFATHVMYASVLKAREGNHGFFYYASEFLNKPLSRVASFVILCELMLVLAVYLILVPTFSALIFPGSGLVSLFGFWFLGSVMTFASLRVLGIAESVGVFGIIAIMASLFLLGFLRGTSFSLEPAANINLLTLLLPFGPLLFSLAGRPAIGKVVEEHKKSETEGRPFSLNRAIFLGTFLPVILYFVFVFGVLRLNSNITPETLNGLSFLPHSFLAILGVLGLIAIWTSYFIIAINIKDILVTDLRLRKIISGIVIFALPLALYFGGFKNFLPAVSFTGSIFLGLEGIFVVSMWRKAFPSHKMRFASSFLYLVFGTAIVYEVAHLFSI